MRIPVVLHAVVAVAGETKTPIVLAKTEDSARAILAALLNAQGANLLDMNGVEAFSVERQTVAIERAAFFDAKREGYVLDEAALADAYDTVELIRESDPEAIEKVKPSPQPAEIAPAEPVVGDVEAVDAAPGGGK